MKTIDLKLTRRIKCTVSYETRNGDKEKTYTGTEDMKKLLTLPKSDELNNEIETIKKYNTGRTESNIIPTQYTEKDIEDYVDFMNSGFKELEDGLVDEIEQIKINKKGNVISFLFYKF